MPTITNRGAASTTVRTRAGKDDTMRAAQLRAFVLHLDMAGVPDDAEVIDLHDLESDRFIGLIACVSSDLLDSPLDPHA